MSNKPPETNQTLADKANAKRTGRKKKPAFEWKGFVSCELSTEDKYLLKTTDYAAVYPFDTTMPMLLEDGYKLSLSHDSKTSAYLAALTDNNPESDACGLCLTARGSSIYKAITALFYKHFVLLEDGWEAPIERDEEYG
jgi:hypothetical protein